MATTIFWYQVTDLTFLPFTLLLDTFSADVALVLVYKVKKGRRSGCFEWKMTIEWQIELFFGWVSQTGHTKYNLSKLGHNVRRLWMIFCRKSVKTSKIVYEVIVKNWEGKQSFNAKMMFHNFEISDFGYNVEIDLGKIR